MKILTPDDLANMLKMPRRAVIGTIAKQPGFPQSLTGWRKPTWLEEAVLEFFRKKSASH
jgi:hypothetical protein